VTISPEIMPKNRVSRKNSSVCLEKARGAPTIFFGKIDSDSPASPDDGGDAENQIINHIDALIFLSARRLRRRGDHHQRDQLRRRNRSCAPARQPPSTAKNSLASRQDSRRRRYRSPH